jgi:hypothetical protein
VTKVMLRLLIVIALAGCLLSAGAQSGTSVSGTVTDPSGAVIAGMQLSLVSRASVEDTVGGDGGRWKGRVAVQRYGAREHQVRAPGCDR